jgi:glucokinase
MMAERFVVGIDVGGTSIKAGLVDVEGRVVARYRVATPSSGPSSVIVQAIVDAGQTVIRHAREAGLPVAGVGVGVPNYSIGPNWAQTHCNNLPGMEGVALRPLLLAAFGEPIACDLDTNAAALAEHRHGAAAGYARAIVMVIGTGISCGILVDGMLLRHTFGTTGETGHIIVAPESPYRCSGGCRGCLESMASAVAIRRAAMEGAEGGESPALAARIAQGNDLDAEAVSLAADAGDLFSRRLLDQAGSSVGIALVTLMHIYCPDAILIGGGVSAAGDWLIEPARRAIATLAAPFFTDRLRTLSRSAMGPDGGMIGAASLIGPS